MSKKHLKRLNTPRTWDILKKNYKYIKRPLPGSHCLEEGMPLALFLRDILGLVKTGKEVKNVLNNQEILIDGIRRKEPKFIVGLMDIISILSLKENYRVILDSRGLLNAIKIDDSESKVKLCKVKGKTMYHGKVQLNLSDGRNIFDSSKNYSIGGCVLIEVPSQKIKEFLPLERNCKVLIIGGKKSGKIALVDDIKDDIMKCRTDDGEFETSKRYAFVVGKEKPSIKIQ
jgi:small subunit ribosomal protein S4e